MYSFINSVFSNPNGKHFKIASNIESCIIFLNYIFCFCYITEVDSTEYDLDKNATEFIMSVAHQKQDLIER